MGGSWVIWEHTYRFWLLAQTVQNLSLNPEAGLLCSAWGAEEDDPAPASVVAMARLMMGG